ncbi:MAG TPA: DUF4079 domain-containing protein [Elainellaceae cyanobacterium]
MNLPSFLWLWRIAAWSMGLSIFAYFVLASTGGWMFYDRHTKRPRPQWLRPLHYSVGGFLAALVLLLLMIGIVGTIGHYGGLGHSLHLVAGLIVVALTLTSAWSATRISSQRPWARRLHIGTNILLFFGFMAVSLSGWVVVQKYLP